MGGVGAEEEEGGALTWQPKQPRRHLRHGHASPCAAGQHIPQQPRPLHALPLVRLRRHEARRQRRAAAALLQLLPAERRARHRGA